MENYFNYFTEIEEHFQRHWGGILRFSPLDWCLIETWRDSGIPLEAVLRGIDRTFENWEKKKVRRKVNGLGFCTQEVLSEAERMKEAAVGGAPEGVRTKPAGFDAGEIAAFLRRNADQFEAARLPEGRGISSKPLAIDTARTLRDLAAGIESQNTPPRLEDLERHLTVLEEKLFAILMAASPSEEIVAFRAEADRAMVPYRRKMQAAQIEQLQKQYVQKRLLEKYGLPRLSLFYM